MWRHLFLMALCVSCYADTNYRLNTPIRPSFYAIAVTPYFNTGDDLEFTFDGEVIINFSSDNNTNQIKLHSEDLIFTAANITVSSLSAAIELNEANALVFDEHYTFAFINLQSELQAGVEYTLKIVYRGPIRKDLKGFYRNYYSESGVMKWLGATQMEPTHARKVFPCFDEPELKAQFSLTIDRPESYQPSLANTKLQTTIPLSNGYVREVFYPTPRMSTYLVAFLVSEFKASEYLQNGTKEIGVFTRPEAMNQSTYAFDFGYRVVNALGEYFGIDYYSMNEYLKLDHIALPDFNAGAMENWGLIKYRESYLLYVPEESPPNYKYRVAQIVAHETTHMWFGNLVTCHWWSNTWLNEGFANYFQDYITALIEPEIGSEDMLVTSSVFSAYDADELPDAPPITNINVNSPAEISGHFGTITYQKAGSIIRMIHHLIGDEAFKMGLNNYLDANRFTSGYPEKLYNALELGVSSTNALSEYPGFKVEGVMNSWISQAGHPVLDVDIDYEEETVTLSQERFYINPSHSSNELYKIPITYTTAMSPNSENTKPAFIMNDKEYKFRIANISQNQSWVIFNIQETGFYRVNYDDQSWRIIANALKGEDREKIHYLNRAKIVNDLFAFFYADLVDFNILYEVLEFLSEETNFSVWSAAVRNLDKLMTSYLGTDTLKSVEAYAVKLADSLITKIGYAVDNTDSFETLRNRMQILELACKAGHTGCIEQTTALFNKLKNENVEVSPSLRPVVYCQGLKHGEGVDYDFMWNRMVSTNVANEARTIGEVLGCSRDTDKLKQYLVSALDEVNPTRFQDLTMPLTSVLSRYENLHLVLHELQENYILWTSIYITMDSVLTTIASALHTTEDFEEFENWLSSCTVCTETAIAAAKTSLASSKTSAKWAEDHQEDLLKSLGNAGLGLLPSLNLIFISLLMILYRN